MAISQTSSDRELVS